MVDIYIYLHNDSLKWLFMFKRKKIFCVHQGFSGDVMLVSVAAKLSPVHCMLRSETTHNQCMHPFSKVLLL